MRTQKAIDAIEAGGFLMAEHDDEGVLHYRCVPGGGVTPRQARAIIDRLKLRPNNDALLPDMPSQTWGR